MTENHQQIPVRTPAEERHREKKRRRNEFLLAAFAFLLVLVLTSIQINQLRAGDALFMAMFNINFVLLLGILFVVLRNAFKLLLERRRKVLGSRLRTRLVFAFVALSLLPCLLMFLVTTKYVQLSMDFWFKDQMETSMDAALDVARSVYDKTGARLTAQGKQITRELRGRRPTSSLALEKLLAEKRQTFQAGFVGILDPDRIELTWQGERVLASTWQVATTMTDWDTLSGRESFFFLADGPETDAIFMIHALEGGKQGYLLLAEDMGRGFKARLDRISKGKGEYKNLRQLKQPLKRMLYSSLGVLTGLIILGAIWYAFRVAREIAAPLHALAAGTTAIAKGDFTVRLNDSSSDELGVLIRSFNAMTEDLQHKQEALTGANAMLEEQNLRIAGHSQYIETVLNTVASGVISFNQEGTINTVNNAAAEILHMHRESLVGQPISNLLPSPHGHMLAEISQRLRERADTKVQHTVSIRIGSEERRLFINVVGFATEGVFRGAVAVFEDISELERMQRTAAWREVARRIAHEIKNPLTPIKLSAQRLARKFGGQVSDPAFTQSTTLIVQQVEHLLDMVQEFSAFAKLPEVKPQPGQVPPLAQSITDLFRNSHSHITWELQVPETLPDVPMDKEALQRAFMNIYTNAAQALELSHTPKPKVTTTISLEQELHMLRIDVADNGPGLTQEERSRVFEPYFTHKKGGTGLGLTIVRSIISDHKGYVRAMPRPGGGTLISMELPMA